MLYVYSVFFILFIFYLLHIYLVFPREGGKYFQYSISQNIHPCDTLNSKMCYNLDTSKNTNTPYSLPQLSQPNIINANPPISMKKSSSFQITSPLQDSPPQPQLSPQKDAGSSIKKLFKSFSTDMRNKFTKKGKNGHQLFTNEPGNTNTCPLSSMTSKPIGTGFEPY